MAEQEEKGPLEKPIDLFLGWKASFERTGQRFGLVVSILLVVLIVGSFVWWNWEDITRHPAVAWITAYFSQSPVPIATSGRLAIGVAHLAHDKDHEHETLLLDELWQFDGVETLSIDHMINLEEEDKKKVEDQAQTLLKQTGADVLILGSVISLGSKSAMRLYSIFCIIFY